MKTNSILKKKIEKLTSLLKRLQAHKRRICERYDWLKVARASQLPPSGSWRVWLILAGRGFGKTRTGAETLRQWVTSGQARRIALVGASQREVETTMIRGESGLLSIHPPWEKLKFKSAQCQVVWASGAQAECFGANRPERLRGPQFDCAWVDELAKFPNPQEIWDQLQMCLRLGHPRLIITTTPRASDFLVRLMRAKDTIVTRGSTFDNHSNLAPSFIESIRRDYEGTALGRQELYGEILSDLPGALWKSSWFQYGTPP